MNGGDPAREYIERRTLQSRASRSMTVPWPRHGPPRRRRQEKSQVGAIRREEHVVPGFAEGREFFRTHAQELFTIGRRGRRAGQRHADDSSCDDLRNGQAEFHRLSSEIGGAATAWHETISV